LKGKSAGDPTLGPTDMHDGAIEAHLVPAQVANLGRPEPVPKGDQDHGRIPMTVAVSLRGLDQGVDLAGCQCSRVLSSAFGRRVGATVRKISVGTTNFSAELSNEIPSPELELFGLCIKYEQSANVKIGVSQTVASPGAERQLGRQADVGDDPKPVAGSSKEGPPLREKSLADAVQILWASRRL